MVNGGDVINWEEAMQQVGDDEEFLRELLADLRTETETQVGAIAAIIQVSVLAAPETGTIGFSLDTCHHTHSHWSSLFVSMLLQ